MIVSNILFQADGKELRLPMHEAEVPHPRPIDRTILELVVRGTAKS